jgi:hypothetical protein
MSILYKKGNNMWHPMVWLWLFCITIFCDNSYAQSNSALTNPERSDGFGAQFQTIIYSAIYAELHNKQYVYTPFKAMEHNYSHDGGFIADKERLINFITNVSINNGKATPIPIGTLIDFFEANLSACVQSQALKKIKALFRANKDTRTFFNSENLHIAVHVRRPNSHDSRLMGADTPDAIFLTAIGALRSLYASKSPLFHIYSQGAIQDFDAYKNHDVILHINESVEDTFTAMVFADVLVTAPSSLSYTAGILSDGIIYYIPFWHAALPGWISVDTIKSVIF